MWFFMSFTGEKGFLGACLVEAEDEDHALDVARDRDLDPGGDHVMAIALTLHKSPEPFPPYRLLSREDIEALDGPTKSVGDLADEGVMPGSSVHFLRR